MSDWLASADYDAWRTSDSEVVDVGTFGIDRGEEDYFPGDEYVPEGEDDGDDPEWLADYEES